MFTNIFLNHFSMKLVWHNWVMAILKILTHLLVIGITIVVGLRLIHQFSIKEEFIANRDVRQGYYTIAASGSGFVDGSSKVSVLTQLPRFGMKTTS